MSYNAALNTIEIELNDLGLNNGGNFNGDLEYQAANIDYVYANIKPQLDSRSLWKRRSSCLNAGNPPETGSGQADLVFVSVAYKCNFP